MNIQPGRPVKRRSVKQQNNNSTGVSELCSLFAMIGWTAMILGMFGAFFYAYVSLGNRIAAASGDARKLEEDIARERRESVALKGLEAQRSSRHFIMAQVKRFNLPLAPAKYHQTRKLTVLTAEQAARVPLHRQLYETVRTGQHLRNRQ